MGILDRLFNPAPAAVASTTAEDPALARYRYLLRTAPPTAIEQAHVEAFTRLTPEQRSEAVRELNQSAPMAERIAPNQNDPQSLARMATRAELLRPGSLERAFGGRGMGGGLLTTIAGSFIGSAIAHQLFAGLNDPAEVSQEQAPTADDPGAVASNGEDYSDDDFGGFGD